MEKIAAAARSRVFRLSCVMLLVLMLGANSFAQPRNTAIGTQPYLLVQGPNTGKTVRFMPGESLEWRLVGEEESFVGTLRDLYPEGQALRIGDLLLNVRDIASIRYLRTDKIAALKRYLRIQGVVNLGIIGIAYAADKRVRDDQRSFVLGATAVSTAMIGYGHTNKYRAIKFGLDSRYVLVVAGDQISSQVPDRQQPVRY